MNKFSILSWIMAGGIAVLAGCAEPDYRRLQGETMGTYYAISAAPTKACALSKSQVDAELQRVNDAMSTYLAASELSRFNRARAGVWQSVSSELDLVMQTAATLWHRSGGAFDVTVGPLVNLWGFGPEREQQLPSEVQLAAARALVGMQHLQARQRGGETQWRKDQDAVYVDLSALAKGYGVDQVAGLLVARGCQDFMVDIGGELRVAGKNARGGPWRIGIEVPDAQSLGVSKAVLTLSDVAIATSGDYRNFRVVDGARVDHVIDPRSAAPSTSYVVSATVIHPSAMWADAYATALMVLSMEEGLALAEREGIAVYLMARSMAAEIAPQFDTSSHTRLESRYNAAMAKYLDGA